MSGETSGRARPPGIGEYLFNELRQAFQDIRQKVLEEGWFGRVVTAAPVVELGKDFPIPDNREHAPEITPDSRRSFEELWAPREPSLDAAERELPRQHDIGMDR